MGAAVAGAAGASGVTDGKYCRGGTCGCAAALAAPTDAGGGPDGLELGNAGGPARPGGAATGGMALGTSIKVSALTDGDPTESLTDGSRGASFETQKRPWQRGQLA